MLAQAASDFSGLETIGKGADHRARSDRARDRARDLIGKSVEAMARQPEYANQVRTTMFIGIGLIEERSPCSASRSRSSSEEGRPLVHAIGSILAQAEEHGEEVSEAGSIPRSGLVVGLLAFAVLFFFTWKWVLPKFKEVLEQRRSDPGRDGEGGGHPQGGRQAPGELPDAARRRPRRSGGIIEEARATADQLRRDLQAKAEEESQAIVGRAQEEIGPSAIGCSRSSGPGRIDRGGDRWAGRRPVPRREDASAPDRRVHRRGRLRCGRERQRQRQSWRRASGDW